MNLTEVNFWEKYWQKANLPSVVDSNFSFDRCLSNALSNFLPRAGEVLEIGCAPGKWLHFASKFGLVPSGIEYSNAGVIATKKNLQILNVSYGSLVSADFFQIEPDKHYDVVMSFGFVEHFENVEDVIQKHLDWLKPGGILIIGVPNFRGINRLVQWVLNRDILLKHNLKIMDLSFFRNIKMHLEIISVSYLGSFEPALFIHKETNSLFKLLSRVFLYGLKILRKFKFLDKINHRFFSSYILAVYRKS